MKKFIIIFLTISLFSCENNSVQNTDNLKPEIAKVENILENISQTSEKAEGDFLQTLWDIDARTIGILQHNFESENMIFMTFSELYNALKKFDNNKKVRLIISEYPMGENIYSDDVLEKIFRILQKFPEKLPNIDLYIDDRLFDNLVVQKFIAEGGKIQKSSEVIFEN